ncbi:MAG TPA: helix-turn-helix domain-containing protein [Gemmatimonadales bacterium]|nr:helix-turn-helix domain-containing protein [Gemmatimonadales bacterium]
MMQYREWASPPGLEGQVEAIWSLTGHAGDESQRILPDGCAELILNFADPVVQETGGPIEQPSLMFVGQITGPFDIRPTGRVDLIGVRFRPGGATALVPMPQHELVDQSVPLQDVAKNASGRFAPVFDANDSTTRARLVSEALRDTIEVEQTAVGESADAIVRAWGMIPVEVLATGAGLGMRQLERRFLEEVGMTPKRLARISRFQRVFHAMEQQPAGWTQVALNCGYYDSSHLVRDFHEFAGDAPSRALAELDEFTIAFTRANRLTV